MSDDIPDIGEGIRGRFKFDSATQKLVRIDKPKPLPKIGVITDEIPPTESMATADREIFTSRSKLKAHYKSLGYEITGGDHLGQKADLEEIKRKRRLDIREDVQRAINLVKNNEAPLTEKERQIAKDEEREWKNYKQRQKTTWA